MSLKGIRPQIDKITNAYIWKIESPKPVEIIKHYDNFELSYPQGPIKTVKCIKEDNSQNTYYIYFYGTGLEAPHSIVIQKNGTMEMNWHMLSRQKYRPLNIIIEPNGVMEILWQRAIFPRGNLLANQVRSKHDKQGNLLFLLNGLPSLGLYYKLKLVSPNTYNVQFFYKARAKNWASIINGYDNKPMEIKVKD